MWDGVQMCVPSLAGLNNINDNIRNMQTRDAIFMQFTGLCDKNKKEIYEGDIVSFLDSEGRDSVIEVSFKDGGFYPFAQEFLHSSDCEIDGNIYTKKQKEKR